MNKLTAWGYCTKEDTFCKTHCSALFASMLHLTAHDLFSRLFPSGSHSHRPVLGGVKCLELPLTSAGAVAPGLGPIDLPVHPPSCSCDIWALAGPVLCFTPSIPASKCRCSLLMVANTAVSQLLGPANVIYLWLPLKSREFATCDISVQLLGLPKSPTGKPLHLPSFVCLEGKEWTFHTTCTSC